jgi:hypothetical protein
MLLFALQFMGSAYCHLAFTIHEAKRSRMDLNKEQLTKLDIVTTQTDST